MMREQTQQLYDRPAVLGRDKNGNVNKKSIIFPLMWRLCGRLLSNEPERVLSEKSIRRRKVLIFPLFKRFGPLFLHKKKLDCNRIEPLPTDGRPIIFAPNHYFVEDVISTVLVAGKHAYFFGGVFLSFFVPLMVWLYT